MYSKYLSWCLESAQNLWLLSVILLVLVTRKIYMTFYQGIKYMVASCKANLMKRFITFVRIQHSQLIYLSEAQHIRSVFFPSNMRLSSREADNFAFPWNNGAYVSLANRNDS